MPSKYVTPETWELIKKRAVKITRAKKSPVKATKLMSALLLKGLETLTPDDIDQIIE